MITISRGTLPGIAPGFSTLDDTWIGIYTALTFGGIYPRRADQLTAQIQVYDWMGDLISYLYSNRDSAAQAVAIQALNEGLSSGVLSTDGGKQDADAMLRRMRADELARAFTYSRYGGVDIQGLADQLPGNLRIGQAGGAGGLLIGADVLGRVKALSAEAVLPEGESSSLNDNTQSPAPGTAAEVWADYGTWIVAGAVVLVIGIIYYRWVR